MCGICGQYSYASQKPVEAGVITRMMQSLVHRGPDDEGCRISGPVGLGFRRLSIIDLVSGHQPMADNRKEIWVIFNGEIYNFPELRAELESLGHRFSTRSDTEVIVYGYRQWGEDVLSHLNGMFGLAIWDEPSQKLILGRDAMGIKPLYYADDGGCILFGSEVRSILAARNARAEVDPIAVNLFLRYRYTPSPRTLYEGIKKLAPGTMLVACGGKVRISRWYGFTPRPFSPAKTDQQAAEELLDIYTRAMKRHLLSDVPVGLLLSGGIDSGLLLGLMNLYGKEWPTFTVGYGQTFRDDELRDAEQTASFYGSRHVSVQLTRDEFEKTLPKVIHYLEEPVATSSIVPMYLVCQRARQDVKVALMGQGPDELFGGYRRHLGVQYGAAWRTMPAWVRTLAGNVVRILPRNEMLKRGVHSLDVADRLKRYQSVFSLLPAETIDGLFQEGAAPPVECDNALAHWSEFSELMRYTDELGGFQLIEIRSSLPDELLMFGDKLSMAHGLEVRVPYLDREVVEYVERLGAGFKIRGRSQKWLHRQVCRRFMPSSILKRKKRGFATNVVDQWFQSSLHGRLDGYLMDPQSLMYRILKPSAVQKILEEHRSGMNNHYKVLFSLTVLEEWLRAFTA